MRTIKFRGKYTETGEWRYGYYARLSNEFKEWHCIMTEKDASENYIKDCNGFHMQYTPVVPSTVGQFTGLYDKNGNEIYEGDIVQLAEPNGNLTDCEVKMSSMGYWSITFDICTNVILGYIDRERIEVIGNIHDNPKLLKQKK